MNLVWILLIFLPVEGAGRQVGPFGSQQQCESVQRQYAQAYRYRFDTTTAACIQVLHNTKE